MIYKIVSVERFFYCMRSFNTFKSSLFPRAGTLALEVTGSGKLGCIRELLGAYTMGDRGLLPIKVMKPTSVSPKYERMGSPFLSFRDVWVSSKRNLRVIFWYPSRSSGSFTRMVRITDCPGLRRSPT